MNSKPERGLTKAELLQLRQEGGRWLRELRIASGLSQRELADKLGADYYSFVSQIESGKGAIPPGKLKLWADAVKAEHYRFALDNIRYYEPEAFSMLFGNKTREEIVKDRVIKEQNVISLDSTISHENTKTELKEIISRLERLEAALLLNKKAK